MPMILATGAVHSHLVRQALRTFTSLNVRSAECLDTHYFAVLIGVGATTVNAYLAAGDASPTAMRAACSASMTLEPVPRQLQEGDRRRACSRSCRKMGIAVISSYRGGYNFEAVGLSRALVAEFFPGMPSRISGIGLRGIAARRSPSCTRAPATRTSIALPIGGFYKYAPRRRDATPSRRSLIHMLQDAVDDRQSYDDLQAVFARRCARLPPIHLRDLLDFQADARRRSRSTRSKSITEIRKRFVTPGMSLGALGPEAHETLNIAMNRIGAKSDSRRRRRGPGALQAAAERRQRQLGDQAGRVGPLRRDRGISQPLPRDRDQGRPGRQARRGRPAARLQGHRADRASCAMRRRA